MSRLCDECIKNNVNIKDFWYTCTTCRSCIGCSVKYYCNWCQRTQCDKCLPKSFIISQKLPTTGTKGRYCLDRCDMCENYKNFKNYYENNDFNNTFKHKFLIKNEYQYSDARMMDVHNKMADEIERLNNIIQTMNDFRPPCEKCGFASEEYEKIKDDFYEKSNN